MTAHDDGREPMADRPTIDHALTPRDLEEFLTMFEGWRLEGSNLELLEVGLLGDHEALALRCLEWAAKVRKAQPSATP